MPFLDTLLTLALSFSTPVEIPNNPKQLLPISSHHTINTPSHKAWSHIDGIVFINLPHRQDRYEHIIKTLEEAGAPKDKVIPLAAAYHPEDGHVGCALSHLWAIEYAKAQHWHNVMILEDDASWTINPKIALDQIQTFFEHPPKQWDILLLSGKKIRYKTAPKSDQPMAWLQHATTSTSYILPEHYYDKMIHILKLTYQSRSTWGGLVAPLDHRWMATMRQDHWAIMNPILIDSFKSYSDTKHRVA